MLTVYTLTSSGKTLISTRKSTSISKMSISNFFDTGLNFKIIGDPDYTRSQTGCVVHYPDAGDSELSKQEWGAADRGRIQCIIGNCIVLEDHTHVFNFFDSGRKSENAQEHKCLF